ncbi:hypothetical protein Pmani_016995 [Petrolisthes manimaculis]|uniref:Uncharacterized protein n=1 Tax=Petrolisthes manimaculis TaxID=1843537 RepID=A0AAE1PNL3_9EUCA|nr:hypothetical protein Pmani_016995 [Petrolisthes manimaculis]
MKQGGSRQGRMEDRQGRRQKETYTRQGDQRKAESSPVTELSQYISDSFFQVSECDASVLYSGSIWWRMEEVLVISSRSPEEVVGPRGEFCRFCRPARGSKERKAAEKDLMLRPCVESRAGPVIIHPHKMFSSRRKSLPETSRLGVNTTSSGGFTTTRTSKRRASNGFLNPAMTDKSG